MNPFEIEIGIENAVLLLDTREQDTPALHKRIEAIGLPYERTKLDFGDYSVKCMLDNEAEINFKDNLAIERKMSVDELCACYCNGRDRFKKEFERAKNKGAKIYLLIENASWENVYNGKYRSKMNPSALVASMTAWLARYNCQLVFCKAETTGKIIKDILIRELKERLKDV